MSPGFWVQYGSNCAFIGVLFYTLVLGGWLSERWKRRPGWRGPHLPGDHRKPTMAAPRFRDEPLVPWGRKVTAGVIEYLDEETPS